MQRAGLGVLVFVGLGASRADADAPRPVNLLTAVPTTVAVSSTVDNAKIRPEHMVDGNPKTAWNSRTGQIIGAWVDLRVPADVRVAELRLSIGFTAVDKKLGDLFTQNARIKKLRIYRAGKVLKDVTLDPSRRDLQSISIEQPGGDFRLEVLAAEPGTKKSWREACIGELEVWGTLPASRAPVRSKPQVRLGSLDAPPVLSRAECKKAVYPAARGNTVAGAVLIDDEQLAISPDITVCRFERKTPKTTDVAVELAAVSRSTRKVLGSVLTTEIANGPITEEANDMGTPEYIDRVDVKVVPLTTTENVLLVDVTRGRGDWSGGGGSTQSTVYRVGAGGLAEIATWGSSRSKDMEGGSSNECELVPPTVTAKVPKQLELACHSTDEDWHNEDPSLRGDNYQERTEQLIWNGSSYDGH